MKNFSYVPIDLESRYAIRKKLRASGHFEWNKNYSARDLFVVYDIYLSIQFHWFADFCCMLDVWVFGIDNFQINEIHLHLVFSVKHSERPPCSHRHIYISAQRNAYYSFWMMASLCHWVKKNLLHLVTEIFPDLDCTNCGSCCQKSLSHTRIFTEAAKLHFPTSSFTHA